jgi:hypothetical protein
MFTNKKMVNPRIRYFQPCFEIDSLFFMKKALITTNITKIPFSFVKKAREEMTKLKTM